eukprot:m.745435 g.745435  ORF g.745435 m.745435 type:complete len:68 (+) comp58956_c0_seq19:732-935(+)
MHETEGGYLLVELECKLLPCGLPAMSRCAAYLASVGNATLAGSGRFEDQVAFEEVCSVPFKHTSREI